MILIIALNHKIIGKCVLKNKGKTKTWSDDRYTVHYSDSGVHIVPSKPSWVIENEKKNI